MRRVYCTAVALAFTVTLAAAGFPSDPGTGAVIDSQVTVPQSASADFKLYVKGRQIGTEEVSVARSADGITISGSGRVTAPLDVITNRCEVRYDSQWRPVESDLDAIVHGQYTLLHTTFANGTATTQITQSGQQVSRTATVTPDTIVLLNSYFSVYEGLAMRLASVQPGAELHAFILPQQEIAIQVKSVSEERIQTPGRTLATRHYVLSFMNPGVPLQVDLWADENQRLVHLSVAAQSFDMLRSDVATVAARREVMTRAGDEQVQIPANGFTLAGTLSKPAGAKPGTRYPAVVLVGGSGPTDRDEFVFNIPIFAQVAGSVADSGFLVVRYDKRGVGQSGGRADSATVEDYGEDVRSVVRYLQSRKDVDRKRIAIAGHSEGGWAAMLAASDNKDVAALILIGTPGVPGSEVVLAQQQHLLAGSKISPAERQQKIDLEKKIIKAVLTGNGWEDVPPAARKQADTPWFHSFLAFDPAKVMPKIRQPVLIVQGELDTQAFPAQAERLAQLARSRKSPLDKQVTLMRVPGVNHLLVPAKTGEYDEYPTLPDRNVSKEVTGAIDKWLTQTLAAQTR